MAEKLDEKEITTTERDKLILKQLKFHEIILACSRSFKSIVSDHVA